ncbi:MULTISPECIES: hypothetical protein [unclassified Fusibacter]|uniref:hypothetical protein n=1 Tax=unclassified Fusibacter TaxID=2624464 RepID=UPI0010101747|nr:MULTISPECIES: hypothetical protein [unclassified Fusibacter]MCK8060118.1 hypothetical protein [Fusibacter sp. A2]NPE22260.1 hypothetical protein [Fusibacter sp. A1]RXV61034.1 hypothetical protein DWB64_10470 [Fusibacter sp. A1]
MNKFLALTKLLLIDFFNRYNQQMNIKNKWLSKLVFVLPLLIALPFIQMIYQMYQAFMQLGKPELIVTYVYVASVPLLFLGAFPMVISTLYYAKDLGLLSSLPLKKSAVISAKLTVSYLPLMLLSALTLGPAIYFYSFVDRFLPMSAVLGVLAVLFGPLIPLVVAVLLTMPMMTIIGGKRRRGLWMILGNLLLITVLVGFQLIAVNMQTKNIDITALFLDENGLLYFIGQKFPPSIWMTQMVMGSFGAAVAYLVTQLALVVVVVFISQLLYKVSVQKYNQIASGSVKSGPHKYTTSAKYPLLIKRHIGIILNNPTFVLNILLTMFIPLIMLVITSFTGEFSLEMLSDPMIKPYLVYIFTGLLISPTFMTTLSATAITREGKTFWETRALPITAQMNLSTRIMTSNIICAFGMVILGAAGLIALRISGVELVAAIVFAVVLTHFFSTVDLFINIQRPYLNWTSPTAAIKNNLNILFAFLIRILLGAVGYLAITVLGMPEPTLVLFTASVVVLGLYFLVKKTAYPYFLKKFIEMEIG